MKTHFLKWQKVFMEGLVIGAEKLERYLTKKAAQYWHEYKAWADNATRPVNCGWRTPGPILSAAAAASACAVSSSAASPPRLERSRAAAELRYNGKMIPPRILSRMEILGWETYRYTETGPSSYLTARQ